eukprot:UN05012
MVLNGEVGPPKTSLPSLTPKVELAEDLKKYHRMTKMKIPPHAIQNKMKQDGIDPGRYAEIESFINGASAPTGPTGGGHPPAKRVPEPPKLADDLQKYLRMVRMKIPRNAVENRMQTDGIDRARYQEIEDFMNGKSAAPAPPKPAPAPELAADLKKYHRMVKMKIPSHAVKNKMTQDGIEPSRYKEIEDFMNGVVASPTPPAPKKN